jgi:predicted nuclease of predicted toxin-antitoxin system
VRILLDANLSPKRTGSAFNEDGLDVLSFAADPALGALDDPQVLELAAQQDRTLVTRHSRDFAPLLREWGEDGNHHGAGQGPSSPTGMTAMPSGRQ